MTEFDEFLQLNSIIYAVVLSTDGVRWEEYGNKEKVKYKGIVNQYFPGPIIAKSLNEMLSESILPQVVTQGEVACMLFKPVPNLIVGLFLESHEGVIERAKRSRALNDQLCNLKDF